MLIDALGEPHQRRSLGAGGVHHRPHVVHALLQRRRVGDRVREPGAAPVERDQRERAERVEELAAGSASQISSTWVTNPGTSTRSRSPSPNT